MADVSRTLAQLAEEFWAWRTATAPDSPDDLPRLERPPGWAPDWSAAAITARRRRLAGLRERYRGPDVSDSARQRSRSAASTPTAACSPSRPPSGTLDEAASRLAGLVPMDEETAWEEAVFFAGNPGQGLSYQTGKLQVLDLLADAASADGFDLREFHDRLWREGNVPFSLQRWELLGNRGQLDAADQLAAGAVRQRNC